LRGAGPAKGLDHMVRGRTGRLGARRNRLLGGSRKGKETHMGQWAGIILSGGLNTRMEGRNKAFLTIDGQTFLERIVATLSACCGEMLLVTREPERYAGRDLRVVTDILSARSALTGIHAGLVHMQADYGLCVGCDTPLIKKSVLRMLMAATDPDTDIVVPSSGTYFQPLCAAYAKRCAPVIENQLRAGDFKIAHLFAQMRVKKVPYTQFRTVDDKLVSFFNINTEDDLKRAQAGDIPDIA
jgi:molybdopterin-guanine dinucleotide biosynthesis protein A